MLKCLSSLKPDSLGDVSIKFLNQREKNSTLTRPSARLIRLSPEQRDFLAPSDLKQGTCLGHLLEVWEGYVCVRMEVLL